jgi:uncharacterized membrane-anchored protein
MLGFRKPETVGSRADYAARFDFCQVRENGLKSLYLLAFMPTANHQQAEQCFASTVEQAVFKEFERSWVERTLIELRQGVEQCLRLTLQEPNPSW